MRFQTEKPKAQKCWFPEKGQSAVEFALVVPVLVLLLVVIADFGRVFFVSIAVKNAARAGAQYGSQTNTTAGDFAGMAQETCNDYSSATAGTCAASPCTCGPLTSTASQCTCGIANPPTDPACSTISSTYCAHATSKAVFVTVNTSATFNTILNYQWAGLPSSFTLTGQAIMQVQEN